MTESVPRSAGVIQILTPGQWLSARRHQGHADAVRVTVTDAARAQNREELVERLAGYVGHVGVTKLTVDVDDPRAVALERVGRGVQGAGGHVPPSHVADRAALGAGLVEPTVQRLGHVGGVDRDGGGVVRANGDLLALVRLIVEVGVPGAAAAARALATANVAAFLDTDIRSPWGYRA